MQIASSIVYFIIAIAILITVHEWGHFIVARMAGVKVLRFAIGFGKPIFSYQGRKGTEYVLGIFPLGGYVKMLDEEEEAVDPSELEYAFNHKSTWARIAVVTAGPIMNILFAIVALCLMYLIGVNSIAPIIGEVAPNSIASHIGLKSKDEITSLDNRSVKSWRDFQMLMVSKLGNEQPFPITVKNLESLKSQRLQFPISQWSLDHKELDLLKSIGIKPYIPFLKPIVGQVIKDGAAEAAGLKAGDVVVDIDKKPIKYWHEILLVVQKAKHKSLDFSVERDNQIFKFKVKPKLKKINDKQIGFIGLAVKKQFLADKWIRTEQYPFFTSLEMAVHETGSLICISFDMIWKFITGKVSIRNIGGPIGVAQGASQSAQIGLSYYLSFLALVSVSLGVLNILPVPMLDGGHLLFYFIEVITRRPVPQKYKEKAMVFGLILLLALTALALFNDMSRLIKH